MKSEPAVHPDVVAGLPPVDWNAKHVEIDWDVVEVFARTKVERATVAATHERRVRHLKKLDARAKLRGAKRSDWTSYRKLRKARVAYENGNVVALCDALALCGRLEFAYPWVIAGASKELNAAFFADMPSKSGRHAKPAREFRENMIDYFRWAHVREAATWSGWAAAPDEAADRLRGTVAEGSPSTMKAAQQRVTRRLGDDPGRYYIPKYSSAFLLS